MSSVLNHNRSPFCVGLRKGWVLSPLLFINCMNWIDSNGRVDEGVTVEGEGSTSCLVLLASSEQSIRHRHAHDQYSSACDRVGMKFSTKKTEVLCLSRTPRQCMLQVRGNTLQQVKLKYLGEVFTSDGRENKEIDRWIGKANAALRELYRSVVTKRSFQSRQSIQFSHRSLLRSPPTVMNFGHWLKECYRKCKCSRPNSDWSLGHQTHNAEPADKKHAKHCGSQASTVQ